MERRKPSIRTSKAKNIYDRLDEEKKSTTGKRSYTKRSDSSDDKKPFDRKPKRESDGESRSYGDKPAYAKRSTRGSDDKPSYTKRSSERGSDERPRKYGEKDSYERKPRRESDDDSRSSRSDKPSYLKRSEGGSDDRPSRKYGEKSSYERKSRGDSDRPSRSYGDKPSYEKRSERGSDDRPARKYGEKSSFDRKPRTDSDRPSRSYGDKPSYEKRSERGSDDRPARKYGEKSSFDRKPRTDSDRPSRSYGDKPSYEKRSERGSDDRPARKYGEKSSFDRKPRTDSDRPSRSYGDKPSYEKRSTRGSDDKPRKYSEKTPYEKKPRKEYDHESHKYSDKPYVSKNRNNDFDESSSRKYSDKDHKSKTGELVSSKRTHAEGGNIRLNKYIANAGICSRREADKLIESGAVTVNGVIVSELGYKVHATDIVSYGGTPIKREKSVYVLLNKPKDYITTLDDPEGRKTVLELIKNAGRERIYPVGRLDRNTTGLLLLTNDGEMTAKLTHPKYGVRKVYHIHLDKNLRKEDMAAIAAGLELEDGPVRVDSIEYAGDGSDKKEIGIEIHSGRNRIIRRIFEHLDYEVLRLDRVIFAGLNKKDLPRGRWRFLTEKEVSFLKMV